MSHMLRGARLSNHLAPFTTASLTRCGLLKSNMLFRVAFSSTSVDYLALKKRAAKDIENLAEVKQHESFMAKLRARACVPPADKGLTFESIGMSQQDVMTTLRAGLMTNAVHTESRISTAVGQGFYTIGPCGEELLAAVGLVLQSSDAVALHYRHLATSFARQISGPKARPAAEILLDRARGHVVSRADPVSGGVHCCIGGDFLVTSTLASQATPAVGRALGNSLAYAIGAKSILPKNALSYVSMGDGSINNAHFLAAINTAEYAKNKHIKCPVVFAVSDNGLSISLKGDGYLSQKFSKHLAMPVFQADGTDMMDVWRASKQACDTARGKSRAVFLYFHSLPRRFGHAATDRQGAYLSQAEIMSHQDRNPLEGACAQAVAAGYTTYEELVSMAEDITAATQHAFAVAMTEAKIDSLQSMLDVVEAPLAAPIHGKAVSAAGSAASTGTGEVMRKLMTRVIEEQMSKRPNMVYIGEDVCHGGYYLVTDSWDPKDPLTLAQKFPKRVLDFPPDETSLVGAGMGFAQVGLLPVVEIPYAKYLDCGADIFFEACISHWLSRGTQPNGMLIRLQGFDRGLFGGNFHTHNTLHIPAGLDVVCYSNGADYVRGFRYCLLQASVGRVVMSVDCTNLLNLRHVHDKDDAWRKVYPDDVSSEMLTFAQVMVYKSGFTPQILGGVGDAPLLSRVPSGKKGKKPPKGSMAIVAYGNGVVTALQARATLAAKHGIEKEKVHVIDCPYLSKPPDGLKEAMHLYEKVVFADICKQGQHPFAGFVTLLQQEHLLPAEWRCVAAPRTYNPLGSIVTFLNEEDIVNTVLSFGSKKEE